ncbi:MAG: hypothetical protein K6C96_08230 [Butyrivibrio sp.]|nr:hypothetical protein [Butyrivibrio sp.]
MKLKYYLRGMGIGIILTAIVMGFALGGRKATISDAEVIRRAKELGMIEAGTGTLSQNSKEDGYNNDQTDTSSSDTPLGQAGEKIPEEIDQTVTSPDQPASDVAGEAEEGEDSQTEEGTPESESSGDDAQGAAEGQVKTTDVASAKDTGSGTSSGSPTKASTGTSENTTSSGKNTSAQGNDADTGKTSSSEVTSGSSSSGSASSGNASSNSGNTSSGSGTSSESGTGTGTDTSTGKSSSSETGISAEGGTGTSTGKTVTIPGGLGSEAVAAILEREGLIDNASSFNRYLVEQHIDRIIRSGVKSIPEGASYEQIANIITK